ncbi:f-box domain cyclin-like protein [Neofusicoccum parvum]|uniref:F-box domain cyclin-like protein n=1 Tax=Neofusicoccum parvum TaxID=310453 RepID=A0ACB5S5K7_9PEZI|nr:f-box domain cyclin-like protein [Neofusicoccum parvum]
MVEPSPAATLAPPTQCQITRMPVEMLDAIFAEVQVWETLIALTCTCWRFREVLEPCIYRSVIIRSAGGLSSFHHALQAKPSRAELVRSFAVNRGERALHAYRARHSSATADELSDFCLIPILTRLEHLHLESFFMDQAEFNAILLRAAQGELLRSLKTCTLNIQHPSFSTIGGHVFETILLHPTLERLTIHLFDHGLRPHTHPPTALRALELRDSRLSPAGLRLLLRQTRSLSELVFGGRPGAVAFSPPADASDMSDALGEVALSLTRLAVRGELGALSEATRLGQLVRLRRLTIAGAAWLLPRCAPGPATEAALRERLPPRLELLETSGWGEGAGGFVDEPLLRALRPVFEDRQGLAPALRRIDLPSRGGCGEVSTAFRTACEVNGIVVSQSDVLEVT